MCIQNIFDNFITDNVESVNINEKIMKRKCKFLSIDA